MEFASREAMLAYEKARENYYMRFLNTKNIFEFYKLLFMEVFIPKYRELKREYDGYYGGWYRDEKGIIRANDVAMVDRDRIEEGSICIDHLSRVHVFQNNVWARVA